MVFSSTVFLFLFLPGLLLCYYFPVKDKIKRSWRNLILLLSSLGFYAWGEPLFVVVMVLSVLINWYFTIVMTKSANHKKFWMTALTIFNVLLIGVFKYVTFISKNLATVFNNSKLILEIALPIGISFFTFQMMSYVFDVYYGQSNVQKNPLHLMLFITLFPQLIAGPIVRYQDVEDEIINRIETFDEFSVGVKQFIYGLSKKVLLANFVGQVADNVFDYVSAPSVLTAWLGIIAYTLQIYFDFSGYSDMAIGLGRMFGFHFCQNFNYPYVASSVTDFWHRWHISLSTWFRDYVYIPLGGNRVTRWRWIFNLFVVWALTGIWHGANWTFVLWGLLYFAFLLLEKLTHITEKMGLFSHVYTLLVIMLAWVFFRSDSIGSGFQYIGFLFGIGASAFCDATFLQFIRGTYTVLLISCIASTPLLPSLFRRLPVKTKEWLEVSWLLLLLILSILQVVSASYNPFIYFNF